MKHLSLIICSLIFSVGIYLLAKPLYTRLRGGKTIGQVVRKLKAKGVSDNNVTNCDHLILLGLKSERQLHVYGQTKSGKYTLIKTYPFTAYSGNLGPKLREGDRQIPEGIYSIESLNPNSNYHLSIKLNYPNAFDQKMGAKDGRENLGSDIFIHGKSVTIGCIPIGDDAIEELFLMVAEIGIEQVQVIIAPHDFRQIPSTPNSKDIAWVSELYTQIRQALIKLGPE